MTVKTFVATLVVTPASGTYTLTYLVAAQSLADAQKVMLGLAPVFAATATVELGTVQPISLAAFKELSAVIPVRAQPDVMPPLTRSTASLKEADLEPA